MKSDQKTKKKKPEFLRRDWHKKIRLGKIKKNRKWRAAKGRHNKVRLKQKGYPKKPSIGFRADKDTIAKVKGLEIKRIENLKQASKVRKGEGIIIGKIGKKKREEIIKQIKEKGAVILNKYKKKNATQ